MDNKFEVCDDDGNLVATYQHESLAYEHAKDNNLIVYDHQLCVYTDPYGMIIRNAGDSGYGCESAQS